LVQRIWLLGQAQKLHQSMWFVKSYMSATQAVDFLKTAVDFNDSLVVVNASADEIAWVKLAPAASNALHSRWSAQQFQY
jgi:hypothetical protein